MLSPEWLSAFVPVGTLNGADTWQPLGAGVLFHAPPFVWLVTANHVIKDAGAERVAVLVSLRSGGVAVIDLTSVYKYGDLSWIRDSSRDLAIGPMPLAPEWNIKAVGEDLCMKLEEVSPSMQCFTVGCPYGVPGLDPQRATPLVLDGVVAGTNPATRSIYISAPTFPGNSGGPILVVRVPYSPSGGSTVGRPTVLLAGIVRETALVQGSGESQPIPPLHLGVGISITAAIEMLQSPEAAELARKVAQAVPNNASGK